MMAEYMNKGRNVFSQFDTYFNNLDSVKIKESSFKMESLKMKGGALTVLLTTAYVTSRKKENH